MTKKTLVKKLILLKSIKPNKEWSSSSRDILLSQIKAQGGYEHKKVSFFEGFFAYADTAWAEVYRHAVQPLFARPSHMVATLTVVLGSALSALAIAQNSVPGDTLYTVKKATEHARVALVSPENRSELEFELAEKRMKEFDVLSSKKLSPKERGEKTALLAADLSKNLEEVANNLDRVNNLAEPKKVVKLATLVKQRTASYGETLAQNKNVAEKDLEAIQKNIDGAEGRALKVIIDKGTTAGVSQADMATHLEGAIKQTEGLIEKVSMKVIAVAESNPRLVIKTEDAKKALEQAKELVGKGDFKSALEKITLSKELLRSIEESGRAEEELTKVKLID